MAVLCWFFPIPEDYFGDAVFVKPAIDFEIPEWDDRLAEGFTDIRIFYTKNGLRTFYELNNYFTWLLGLNGTIVARIFQSVFSFFFVGLWLGICRMLFHASRGWFWLFAVVGVTSPLLGCFMGHYEYYFLTYTAMLGWFYLLTLYFFKEKKWVLFILPIAFVLLLLTHITCWLLSPTLVLPYLLLGQKKFGPISKLTSKKGMWALFGGTFLMGLCIAYFGIYENYNGPRQYSMDEFENSLFLPLYTDEPAPLDRYNLFSFSHFLDYFNLTLMWAGGVTLLWILVFLIKADGVDNQETFYRLMILQTVIYLVAFFMFNPLLSAMLDWDLFVLPALVFLPAVMIGIRVDRSNFRPAHFAGPIIGLSLLGASFFPVHASNDKLAQRYNVICIQHFKTYWHGCSTCLRGSVEMMTDNSADEKKAMLNIINELHPYAIQGHDLEYSGLLHHLGLLHKRTGETDRAYGWFTEAHSYSQDYGSNLFQLSVVCFELGRYDEAFNYVTRLVELNYEPVQRSIRMAIHISLAAKEYQAAANYSVMYLNRWPDDADIQEVEYRLRNGISIDTIVDLFKGSETRF